MKLTGALVIIYNAQIIELVCIGVCGVCVLVFGGVGGYVCVYGYTFCPALRY